MTPTEDLHEMVTQVSLTEGRDKQLPPTCFLLFGKNLIPVIFEKFDLEEKRLARRMFEWATAHGATGVSIASESWTVFPQPGRDATREVLDFVKTGKSLSEHPDRQTVLTINTATPTEVLVGVWHVTETFPRTFTQHHLPAGITIQSRFTDNLAWQGVADPINDMKTFLNMWGGINTTRR